MVDVSATVREQVQALLDARPEVSQVAFGRAVGRGYSWVSSFLAGRRSANDVRLLVRIARFFGVSVDYLLRESDQAIDAETKVLVGAFSVLAPRERDVVLQLALRLARTAGDSAPPDRPADATPPTRGRTRK